MTGTSGALCEVEFLLAVPSPLGGGLGVSFLVGVAATPLIPAIRLLKSSGLPTLKVATP